MSRVEALVTPELMKWARESAGLTLDEAAKKIGRPEHEIAQWESGELRPSIAQARKACEVYRRPLAVLYLPSPPEDFDTLRDFRKLPRGVVRSYSSMLRRMIRTAVEHQSWVRDFLHSEGMPPLPFVGSETTDTRPEEVAGAIREALDVDLSSQQRAASREAALSLWMTHAEKNGIFIFRHGLIDLEECRGFTLADPVAPFVYLNSADALAGLLFTLAHELCHIWIQESGVSNCADSGDFASSDDAKIEVFCNAVASEILLPNDAFNREWTNMSSQGDLKTRIRHLSNVFKVSEETVARKLLEQSRLSQAGYRSLRQAYQKRWEEIQAMRRKHFRESSGGPSYYLTKVTSNGYAYTQTVISAYRSGSVSGRDAATLLDAKVNHLDRLGGTAGMPASLRA